MSHLFRGVLWGMFVFGALTVKGYSLQDDRGVESAGVIHNIAEDRLVENVGGIYQPEGLDKYVKRRFDDLQSELGEISDRLKAIESRLPMAEQRVPS